MSHAGFRFTFTVGGDKLIDRQLLRIGNRAIDAKPAFERIGALLIAETRLQFETEGRHASGGWRKLKTATVEAKRRHGLRPQILQATGSLLDSLTQPDDPNMVFKATASSVTYGSKLPYALAHQKPRAGSHLPRRQPLAFTEQTKRAAVKILQRYLVAGEV